jgi:hypothetical protein
MTQKQSKPVVVHMDIRKLKPELEWIAAYSHWRRGF